jgi:hypothetical protein
MNERKRISPTENSNRKFTGGDTMPSTAIATVVQMMEPLPEPVQERVVEHLRTYLQEVEDELRWDALFHKSQPQLVAAARRARKEIAAWLATPLDFNQL